MRWNEDTQQLITCSKDKTVKIWELPDAWVDESNEKSEPKEIASFKKKEGITNIQPKAMKKELPVKEESK